MANRGLGDENVRLCSKCGAQMEERDNGRVIVDICPACGGFFLDRGELDETIAQSGLTRHLASLQEACNHCKTTAKQGERVFPSCPYCGRENHAFACPACRGAMRPVVFEGVLLEVCPSCFGLYLDRQELGEMAEGAEAGRWKKNRVSSGGHGRHGRHDTVRGRRGRKSHPERGSLSAAAAGGAMVTGTKQKSESEPLPQMDQSRIDKNQNNEALCVRCGNALKYPYYTADGLMCQKCFKKKDYEDWGDRAEPKERNKSTFLDFMVDSLIDSRYMYY